MLKVGFFDRASRAYALTQATGWTWKWQRFGNEPMARVQWVVCHRPVLPRYFIPSMESILWALHSIYLAPPRAWRPWLSLCSWRMIYSCRWLGTVPEQPGWLSDQKHDGREREEVTRGSGRAYNSANQSNSQAQAGKSTHSSQPTPAHPAPPLDCSCRCWVLCVCVWLGAAKNKRHGKIVVIKVNIG